MKYKKTTFPDLYTPSIDEVKKYHRVWESLVNYREHESALSYLFRGEDSPFKENKDISKVIIKVVALNDFYSTNIYRVHDVANNILNIKDFDKRLQKGDLSLIEDLRKLVFRSYSIGKGSNSYLWNKKELDIYSFATKYCSHHQPDKFPIYDKYVDKVLTKLKRQHSEVFNFENFDTQDTKRPLEERKKGTLKDYKVFVEQINNLRNKFNLKQFSFKDIDRYLWQLGKRYFAPYPDLVNGEINYDI